MAKDAVVPVADALFAGFVAPLVVGGDVKPVAPVGARLGLRLHEATSLADPALVSHVQLARVRVARRLAPVDRLEPLPSAAEWRLLAALHDLVQATHPDLDALGRRGTAARLLALADALVLRAGAPTSARDALSRHSLLARLFELTRHDVALSWWTGRARFRGTTPPARLTEWPELRRVREERTERDLLALGGEGSAVSRAALEKSLAALVEASPLTDAATASRAAPSFTFSPALLALAQGPNGRTLVLRALAEGPDGAVDRALGVALRGLLAARATARVELAVGLLGERMIARASTLDGLGPRGGRAGGGASLRDDASLAADDASDPRSLAIAVGAHAGRVSIAQRGDAFPEAERRVLLERLAPAAEAARRYGLGR